MNTGLRISRPSSMGFTLVETLVASTLFVMVLTAVYGTFQGITSANRRIEEVADASQTARVLLARIAADLSRIYVLPAPSTDASKWRGPTASALEGGPDARGPHALTIVTVAGGMESHAEWKASLRRVRYCFANDAHGFRHFVREETALGSLRPEDRQRLSLSGQVLDWRLGYLDPDSGAWQEDWQTDARLPAAVSISLHLQWLGTTRSEWFSSVAALPVVVADSALPQSTSPAPIGGSTDAGSHVDDPKAAAGFTPGIIVPAKPQLLPDAGVPRKDRP